MKRVIIVHGWGGDPNNCWFPWLKKKLIENNFEVIIPEMPDTNKPKIETWVPYLKKICKNVDKETYFIGHSVGCQTILRYLEGLEKNKEAGGAIFVAPWMHLDEETIREEGFSKGICFKP